MYKLVAPPQRAPRFAITVGLQEGYGPNGKLHLASEVVKLVLEHLKGAAAEGRPYLTGSVTTGELVYAWPEGLGKAGGGHESQAVYSGEVNPLYNANIGNVAVALFLSELAGVLGTALGQKRVYVAFDGDLWVLEEEGATTPTGN